MQIIFDSKELPKWQFEAICTILAKTKGTPKKYLASNKLPTLKIISIVMTTPLGELKYKDCVILLRSVIYTYCSETLNIASSKVNTNRSTLYSSYKVSQHLIDTDKLFKEKYNEIVLKIKKHLKNVESTQI